MTENDDIDPGPLQLGRFNYAILGDSFCDVFFRPDDGASRIAIAVELTVEEAKHLIDDLNRTLRHHCSEKPNDHHQASVPKGDYRDAS
jgi:hypothetical protein